MRKCKDCDKWITDAYNKQRCDECQKKHKLECQKKLRKIKKRWLTRLGGIPTTMEEIRNYKGCTAFNSRKRNEAQDRDDAVIPTLPLFNEVKTMKDLNKKTDNKKKTRKEIYEDWKYEDN